MNNIKQINPKQLEFINELKILKTEKNMTFQEIADKTRDNGEEVSLSTIKLVFSDKYHHKHDYNNILIPIFNALSPRSEDEDITTKILQTRLDIKNEIIDQLQNRLDTKDKKHKDRELFYMQQIEFLQNQIKFKDEQIKHHYEAIDRKDSIINEYIIKGGD